MLLSPEEISPKIAKKWLQNDATVKQMITDLTLAVMISRWRINSQIAKKFDGGKSAHVLLRGRPGKDASDKFSLAHFI